MPLQSTNREIQELINDWHGVVDETIALPNPLDAAYLWRRGVADDDSDFVGITLVYRNPENISCIANKTGLWVFIPFDDTMRLFPENDHRSSLITARGFQPARVETHSFGLIGQWALIASGEFE